MSSVLSTCTACNRCRHTKPVSEYFPLGGYVDGIAVRIEARHGANQRSPGTSACCERLQGPATTTKLACRKFALSKSTGRARRARRGRGHDLSPRRPNGDWGLYGDPDCVIQRSNSAGKGSLTSCSANAACSGFEMRRSHQDKHETLLPLRHVDLSGRQLISADTLQRSGLLLQYSGASCCNSWKACCIVCASSRCRFPKLPAAAAAPCDSQHCCVRYRPS